jgi:hypothetical protein
MPAALLFSRHACSQFDDLLRIWQGPANSIQNTAVHVACVQIAGAHEQQMLLQPRLAASSSSSKSSKKSQNTTNTVRTVCSASIDLCAPQHSINSVHREMNSPVAAPSAISQPQSSMLLRELQGAINS